MGPAATTIFMHGRFTESGNASPPAPPDSITRERLTKTVEEYFANPVYCHHDFDELVDTIDYICGCHNDRYYDTPEPRYKKHGHERCFSNEQINSIARQLADIAIEPNDDFDTVIDRVREINPKGMGDLSSYDFCLRLCGSNDILPQRFVYIHSGALEGARHLRSAGLLEFSNGDKRIPVENLPKEMLPLVGFEGKGTLHVENFLCVSKHKLEKLINQYIKQ